MKHADRHFLVAATAMFLAILPMGNRAWGQFTTASLSGTVVDQSDAAVPDARVTVQNVDTGFTQSVTSGAAGDYLFSRLPIGNYKLTVEKQGLTTYVQSGITLTVSQSATQKVTMSVAAATMSVAG